jgi:glutamine synthetase
MNNIVASTDNLEALCANIDSLVAEGRLDTVGVAGGDFNGILRGKYMPTTKFLAEAASPMALGDMVFVLDPSEGVVVDGPEEGWWPVSDRGFKEMRCLPIPESFRLVPWRDRTALILADYEFNDGKPVDAAPRRVLQRVVERARSLGFEPMTGYELEFFVFRETASSAAAKGYRDLEPGASRQQAWSMFQDAQDEHLIRHLQRGLESFGVPIETWLVEGAHGQYELNVPYADTMCSADRALLHRFAVKELAEREGLLATFMARPPGTAYGSSMHLHHSLRREDGTNAFSDPSAPAALSALARHFIAGQLALQRELSCLYAPNVNSYKRLLPGLSSGPIATWGFENWSTAVRVISSSPAATRVEFRTAGADANPYLAIAASLAAGLYGIEQRLEPPPATEGLADDVVDAPRVPRTLEEAMGALDGSAVARRLFGDHFVDVYLATRRGELDAFQHTVTDWEAARYLRAL